VTAQIILGQTVTSLLIASMEPPAAVQPALASVLAVTPLTVDQHAT
jgi:hypothetical protein